MFSSGLASRTMKSALLPAATIPELTRAISAESRVAATLASAGALQTCTKPFQSHVIKIADEETDLPSVGTHDDTHSRGSELHHIAAIQREIFAHALDRPRRHLHQRVAPVFLNMLGRISLAQERVVKPRRPLALHIHPRRLQ